MFYTSKEGSETWITSFKPNSFPGCQIPPLHLPCVSFIQMHKVPLASVPLVVERLLAGFARPTQMLKGTSSVCMRCRQAWQKHQLWGRNKNGLDVYMLMLVSIRVLQTAYQGLSTPGKRPSFWVEMFGIWCLYAQHLTRTRTLVTM